MEKSYIQFNISEPPEDLIGRIVSTLRRREQRREKARAIAFASVALAALAALVPAFENVGAAAARSGFAGYASLLFSDWGAVLGIWKVFALSLAETAPLFAIAVSATALFVFTWSAAEAVRYTRAARMSLS